MLRSSLRKQKKCLFVSFLLFDEHFKFILPNKRALTRLDQRELIIIYFVWIQTKKHKQKEMDKPKDHAATVLSSGLLNHLSVFVMSIWTMGPNP